MRFSCLAETKREGSQAGVVRCRDQGRLEHHVPRGKATTGDGPFSAKCSAVMRDWANPVSAAVSWPVMVPIPGILPISIVVATAPIPGMARGTAATNLT